MGNNISDFQAGDDLVIGIKDEEVVRQMQQNHGGWNDNMRECMTGPCKLIQGMGLDALIKAPSGALYRINPELLTKYISNEFKPGSQMVIIDDEEKAKKFQNGHGGWSDGMKALLGKPVAIMQKLPDGDYKIKANGKTWTVNPDCFDLTKSNKKILTNGDKVKFMSNKGKVLSFQENHGGWSDMMTLILGEEVEVEEVLPDGDCYVSKYGMKWMVNQLCFEAEKGKEDNSTQFFQGDAVKISDNVEYAKELQKFHGGWVSAMKLVLGKVGTVQMILPTGDVKVIVNGLSFVFNPDLLRKLDNAKGTEKSEVSFKMGDRVRVLTDKSKVKKLQKDHGEWIETMKLILGEKGKVKSIFPDGDLRVKIMGNTITLNPLCVTKVDSGDDSGQYAPDLMRMMSQMTKMLSVGDEQGSNDSDKSDSDSDDDDIPKMMQLEHMKLFASVKAGDVEQTKVLVDMLGANTSMHKISPLTMAVIEGHENIVQLLLDKGANISAKDKDGDTALHIAVQKNRMAICMLLILRGADVNEKNKLEMTAVMTAASMGILDILRYLVKVPGVNLDARNTEKDTALHLAIQKSRLDSVGILLEAGANIMTVNGKEFSSYHLAALRGHEKILEVFLKKAGATIVDLQKEDKFAALHLVALNNHPGCLRLLIRYNADINIRNGKLQTPLHTAVSQRHLECVKILVENKAEINLKDESGDTPLHDGIRAHSMEKMKSVGSLFGMSDMFKLLEGVQGGTDAPEEIVLFLARNGAKFDIKNNSGKTAITACDDAVLQAKLINIRDGVEPPKSTILKTDDETIISTSEIQILKKKVKALEDESICMICYDRKINCTFQCGHISCEVCANNLYECHMCRTPIDKIIRIYR